MSSCNLITDAQENNLLFPQKSLSQISTYLLWQISPRNPSLDQWCTSISSNNYHFSSTWFPNHTLLINFVFACSLISFTKAITCDDAYIARSCAGTNIFQASHIHNLSTVPFFVVRCRSLRSQTLEIPSFPLENNGWLVRGVAMFNCLFCLTTIILEWAATRRFSYQAVKFGKSLRRSSSFLILIFHSQVGKADYCSQPCFPEKR